MSDELLTAADEVRLARRIEQGDMAAKEEMVVRNLRWSMRSRLAIAGAACPSKTWSRRARSA